MLKHNLLLDRGNKVVIEKGDSPHRCETPSGPFLPRNNYMVRTWYRFFMRLRR
jgi:hypothetical protein